MKKPALQPIKDVDGFHKDVHTGAILSTDIQALQAYMKKKENHRALCDDINNVKKELTELKTMIADLIGHIKD